ncbi:MAG: DedA family protein [Desulfovermiculus sp.]|nr:DedA family protein [Desulfovermiculus sp.]
MVFEELINQFGYAALSLGTILEGEAALIIGGILAKQGYLTLTWVMAVACVTTLACDQFFFFLGRTQGVKALNKWPHLKYKTHRITQLVKRHHLWMAVFFRFVYGLRSITPLTIGLCRIPPGRFLVLNIIGIMLWVLTLSWLGYIFGHTLQEIMNSFHHWEIWVGSFLAGIGGLGWALSALRKLVIGRVLNLSS